MQQLPGFLKADLPDKVACIILTQIPQSPVYGRPADIRLPCQFLNIKIFLRQVRFNDLGEFPKKQLIFRKEIRNAGVRRWVHFRSNRNTS